MAKASTSRRAPASSSRKAAWSPEASRGWTLADGLGLTLLIALCFAWPGIGDGSAVTGMLVTAGGLACLPFGVHRLRASGIRGLSVIPLAAGVALLAWGVISAIASGAPWQVSVYGWFGRSDGLLLLTGALGLLISASALTRADVDRLVTWLLAAGAVMVVEAMAQLAGASYPARSQYDGLSAALGNPNFFAAATAILTVLAVGRALSAARPPSQRWAALALALGLAACSALSQSVQGPVALAIGLVGGGIAWSLQHRGKGRGLALSLSALAVVGGVAGVALAILQAGPFAAVREAQTIGYREAYWEAAWRMMSGLPIFGSGPDGFARYVAQFRTENYLAAPGSQIRVSVAHDVPLQYGATFGVIGLIAWLVLMVATGVLLIRALLRGVEHEWLVVSVTGAWIAYLAQAMISIDAPGLKALGWLLTGMVIAVSVNSKDLAGVRAAWTPWLAGALALLAVVIWWPSISTAIAALDQRTGDGAAADAANPLVPCPLRQQALSNLTQGVPPDQLAPIVTAALQVDARCPVMPILASEVLLQAGDIEGAKGAAEIAVETDPLAPGSWFVLSLVREAQGDQVGADEALAEAKRLAAIDPSDTLDQALATEPSAQLASP